MLLPCYCHVSAMLIASLLPCRCHVIAMSLPCLLPCHCHAHCWSIAMLLPCYLLCYCDVIAMLIARLLLGDCHDICHVIAMLFAMLLPCYCHVIAMLIARLLQRYCHVICHVIAMVLPCFLPCYCEPPENQTNQIKLESCNFDFSLNPNQRCQISPPFLSSVPPLPLASFREIKRTKSNMKFAMLISPEKNMNQNQRRKITSLTCLQCCRCHWRAPGESSEPNQTWKLQLRFLRRRTWIKSMLQNHSPLVFGAAGGEPPENQTNQTWKLQCWFLRRRTWTQINEITSLTCLQCCRCHWQAPENQANQIKHEICNGDFSGEEHAPTSTPQNHFPHLPSVLPLPLASPWGIKRTK